MNPQRLSVKDILEKKSRREKITMLTAYDFPLAALVDQAGIDIVLVGDSLANVVLGLESTRQVGMEEMIHHAKAANRAVQKAMLVGDMPYSAYQERPRDAVKNAQRFVEEAGCGAVKLEWFNECLTVAEQITHAGIPVMGHVGLTPQTADLPAGRQDKLGGFRAQGKDAESARDLIQHARELEKKGCFSIVLECIPDKIAELITRELSIPTIGIGAGVHCDGQVLVTHDVLGLSDRLHLKFAKQYIQLSPLIAQALRRFRDEVVSGQFPDDQHSFHIAAEEFEKLKRM